MNLEDRKTGTPMNIAVIYHKADFDGLLSRDVCLYWLPKLYPGAIIHAFGWDYGLPLPPSDRPWERFDQIYIVDLSVPALMERPDLAEKLVWIDHHKTAIEQWDAGVADDRLPPPFRGFRLDGVAACRLCWQWFLKQQRHLLRMIWLLPDKTQFVDRLVVEPELLRLAGEYDIWDKRDPRADVLQYGLKAISPDRFRTLVTTQFDGLQEIGRELLAHALDAGEVVQRYMADQNASIIGHLGHTVRWQGLTFLVCNHARFNSHLFEAGLKPEHDALLGWKYDGQRGDCAVSLYHAPGHEQHDLSAIAKAHGGGGHRGACGFRLPLSQLREIIEAP